MSTDTQAGILAGLIIMLFVVIFSLIGGGALWVLVNLLVVPIFGLDYHLSYWTAVICGIALSIFLNIFRLHTSSKS